MSEYYQDRLNISVPIKCWDAIDNTIEKMGLFSGRTDLLYGAVRDTYWSFLRQFLPLLHDYERAEGTSLEKYSEIKEVIKNNGSSRYHRFTKRFPGPCVKQIPIRPSDAGYQYIDSLSRYLFQEDDVERIQKVCRVALMLFIEMCDDDMTSKSQFTKEYNAMREKASRSRIIIEYVDLDNPPE